MNPLSSKPRPRLLLATTLICSGSWALSAQAQPEPAPGGEASSPAKDTGSRGTAGARADEPSPAAPETSEPATKSDKKETAKGAAPASAAQDAAPSPAPPPPEEASPAKPAASATAATQAASPGSAPTDPSAQSASATAQQSGAGGTVSASTGFEAAAPQATLNNPPAPPAPSQLRSAEAAGVAPIAPTAPATPMPSTANSTWEGSDQGVQSTQATMTPPTFGVWLGISSLAVSDSAFDAFADDGRDLTGVGLGAAWMADADRLRWGLVAGFDYATSSSALRGEATELSFTRLALGPELQVQIWKVLHGYARISLDAVRLEAELEETSSAAALSHSGWGLGAEGNVGVAAYSAPLGTSGVRLFGRLEGGYAWAASQELDLDSDDGPVRLEPLSLGELSTSGLQLRAAFGIGL